MYIHAFLDGRDTPPTSGRDFVAKTMEKCRELGVGKIATVMGRYYAMDRDKRWDRSRTPMTRSSTARACRIPTPFTPSRRAIKTA